MARPWHVLPAVLAVLPGTASAAQLRAWVDLDATRLTAEPSDEAWGATFAPGILLEPGAGATIVVGAAYGRYAGDRWALQGTLDATITPGRVGPLDGELSLSTAALTGGTDVTSNTISLARGRLHLAGTRAGLWAGAGGGAGDQGLETRGMAFGDAGAWASLGPATVSASLLPTTVDPGGTYLDAELALRATWRRLALSAGAGLRWWRGDSDDERWASVGIQWGFTRALALTATAGRFPADPVRGLGDGRYLQVGARLGMGRRDDVAGWALRQAYRSRPPIAEPVVEGLEVRAGEGRRVLVVQAPGATRVEITGDFTDWEPVPLRPEPGGLWLLDLAIPAGSHRFNLRVDGGPWGVPPGVPTLRDEFGGVVGLLVLD